MLSKRYCKQNQQESKYPNTTLNPGNRLGMAEQVAVNPRSLFECNTYLCYFSRKITALQALS